MTRLAVANDAQLIQLVRGALGRDPKMRGLPRPNVSSCGQIVTLHGVVPDSETGRAYEEAVSRVRGVKSVVNKLGCVRGVRRVTHRPSRLFSGAPLRVR